MKIKHKHYQDHLAVSPTFFLEVDLGKAQKPSTY